MTAACSSAAAVPLRAPEDCRAAGSETKAQREECGRPLVDDDVRADALAPLQLRSEQGRALPGADHGIRHARTGPLVDEFATRAACASSRTTKTVLLLEP